MLVLMNKQRNVVLVFQSNFYDQRAFEDWFIERGIDASDYEIQGLCERHATITLQLPESTERAEPHLQVM